MKNCSVSTKETVYAKRCFITGEYCSHQTKIHRVQEELHGGANQEYLYFKKEGGEQTEKDVSVNIQAFVIMNFSDMSDVIYEWRIKPFIESLTQFLYMDPCEKKLYCYERALSQEDIDRINAQEHKNLMHVEHIKAIRADSDFSSNYVICNRICQQMQIADLIIVDVSTQNANVFYEFGMAVAFGKLILPICYSESYYKKITPEKRQQEDKVAYDSIKKYIGCFPWRKDLYEYYGIRYRRCDPEANDETLKKFTQYLQFEDIKETEYDLVDKKYTCFPYDEYIMMKDSNSQISSENVGKKLYEKLAEGYNNKRSVDNTLVIYTMDKFLNKNEAGLCIINFYQDITKCMRTEKCFCGERVGVLAQETNIIENNKDSKLPLNILYSISEIIHIGVNQATYYTERERIKPQDAYHVDNTFYPQRNSRERIRKQQQKDEIINFTKQFTRNRGILIYPNNPVYVDRVRNDFENEFLASEDNRAFCLYHIMLRTLKCTNEIVVDISNNCLQSLFWLGAAHATGTNAISVKYETYDKENEVVRDRKVFDVSGLWTAIFHYNDTRQFYNNLVSVQRGIDFKSKLLLSNQVEYKEKMIDMMFPFDPINETEIKNLYNDEKNKEKLALESFYRNCFWEQMLQYNRLKIYISQIIGKIDTGGEESRLYVSKWDNEAVSILSHYLSKRKLIGEYRIETLPENPEVSDMDFGNFISIGANAKPFGKSLAKYIEDKNIDGVKPHEAFRKSEDCAKNSGKFKWCTGFQNTEGQNIRSLHLNTGCMKCCLENSDDVGAYTCEFLRNLSELKKEGYFQYKEYAQVLLWKENQEDETGFKVSLVGTSGPSTYILTSLFIDEKQRFRHMGLNKKSQFFLCEIQFNIRKRFTEYFNKKLKEKCLEILNQVSGRESDETREEKRKEQYVDTIIYSINYYLSTVLYRYFLPFLSQNDIKKILNGTKMYINFMVTNDVSPFSLHYQEKEPSEFTNSMDEETVKKIIKAILEVLQSVLEGFQGIEIFYEVQVKKYKENYEKLDTRKVESIELHKENGEVLVNCFFTP